MAQRGGGVLTTQHVEPPGGVNVDAAAEAAARKLLEGENPDASQVSFQPLPHLHLHLHMRVRLRARLYTHTHTHTCTLNNAVHGAVILTSGYTCLSTSRGRCSFASCADACLGFPG